MKRLSWTKKVAIGGTQEEANQTFVSNAVAENNFGGVILACCSISEIFWIWTIKLAKIT